MKNIHFGLHSTCIKLLNCVCHNCNEIPLKCEIYEEILGRERMLRFDDAIKKIEICEKCGKKLNKFKIYSENESIMIKDVTNNNTLSDDEVYNIMKKHNFVYSMLGTLDTFDVDAMFYDVDFQHITLRPSKRGDFFWIKIKVEIVMVYI